MNIIMKSVFGSHLYGTNTENSDTVKCNEYNSNNIF